jgi:diaminopimelate epimerase
MQGAGNDFVVIQEVGNRRDWSRLSIAMCDRHYGVGADGLLLVLPSEVADFRMRIFNADGSEANTCGNGIRCLVKYYVDSRGVKRGSNKVTVETLGGVRDAWFRRTGGRVTRVRIGMGKPEFGVKDIPVIVSPGEDELVDIKSMIEYSLTLNGDRLDVDLLSMGNPHAVCFTQQPVSEFALAEIGPKVERHAMFPRGVNFEVARVLDNRRVEARVWEHGVGETLACGSGACAITVAARLHGYIGSRAEISLPGGTLEVEWDESGEVLLSGPAETVFVGEWPEADLEREEPGAGKHIKNEVLA